MHLIFRILCFTVFLIFFTTLAIYFPVQEEITIRKPPPEIKEPSVDLNQFAGRVKQRDLPKLLSGLLDHQNRARSSGFIYIYKKNEDEDNEIYKVGRTASTVGVDKRLKQWKRKCKKRLRLVKKFFVEGCHELCESMIHLELKSKGLWCGFLKCKTCCGSHKEFFKADLDTIIECCCFWVDYFNELEKNKHYLM